MQINPVVYDDDMRPLKWCNNPLCPTLTSTGSAYCCGSCANAHESGYEIHASGPLGHTSDCLERQEQRKELILRVAEGGI